MKLPPRPPWTEVVPPWKLLGIGLSGMIIYLLVPMIFWRVSDWAAADFRSGVLICNGVAMLLAGAMMVAGFKLAAPEWSWRLQINFAPLNWREGKILLLAVLVLIPAVAATTWLWSALLDLLNVEYEKCQLLMVYAAEATPRELILLLVMAALVVPGAEELFFRRILFALFYRLGPVTGWVVPPLIFALCHFYLAGLPGLFLLGLGFQYLYWRSGKLTLPIAAHGLLNGITVLLTFWSGNPEL